MDKTLWQIINSETSSDEGIEIAEIIFGCKCPKSKQKMIYKLFSDEEKEAIEFYSVYTKPQNRFELIKKSIKIPRTKR